LGRFGLIHVHTIAPAATSAVSTNAGPQGFQFDSAAIGAGVTLGLILLGMAGAITVRWRAHVPHP
jgi:hypothetical protein